MMKTAPMVEAAKEIESALGAAVVTKAAKGVQVKSAEVEVVEAETAARDSGISPDLPRRTYVRAGAIPCRS